MKSYKIFRRKSKRLEGNQKSSQETKMRKPKSLEGSQKLQKETKHFRRKPHILKGNQDKVLEENQNRWEGGLTPLAHLIVFFWSSLVLLTKNIT